MTRDAKNLRALTCPKVGDRWSEMYANWMYICAVDGAIKALFIWGEGRKAYLFESVDEFQDWVMYSTAPVKDSLHGWTWTDFVDNKPKHDDWEQQWNDEARKTGVKRPESASSMKDR